MGRPAALLPGLLLLELQGAVSSFHALASSGAAGKLRLDVVAVVGAWRGIAAWDVFLRSGHAGGIEIAIAVVTDFAFNEQVAALALDAVKSTEVAVLYHAGEAIREPQCASGRIAGNRGLPFAVETSFVIGALLRG